MMELNIKNIKIPSEDETVAAAKKYYEELHPHVMPEWCPELRAASMYFTVGYFNNCFVGGLYDGDPESMHALEKAFDQAADELCRHTKHKKEDGFFVKLVSRSPKDSLPVNEYGKPKPIYTAKEASNAIACSMRCMDDLSLLSRACEYVGLIVRPFKEWEPWQEWRCFVKNNELIGISQYYYEHTFEELTCGGNYLKELSLFVSTHAKEVFSKINPYMEIDSYIFDMVILNGDAFLLETNPWGKSDPCLFGSYEAIDKINEITDEPIPVMIAVESKENEGA